MSAGAAPSSSKSKSKRDSAARRSSSATSKRTESGARALVALASPSPPVANSSGKTSADSSKGSRHMRRNQNVRLTEKAKRDRKAAAAKATATKAKQRAEHVAEMARHEAELTRNKRAREALNEGLRKAAQAKKDTQTTKRIAILDAYAKKVGGTVSHDYVRLPDKTIMTLKDIMAQHGKGNKPAKRIEKKGDRERRLKRK